MNKGKILIFYFIFIFLILGCSEKKNREIKFWKFTDTLADSTLQKYVDIWNKIHPETPVKFYTFSWNSYISTKLTAAFVSGAGPDVFWISPGDFMKMVNNGIAYPLNKYFTQEALEDFIPISIEAVTVEGNICSIPFEMEPLAIFYNRKLLNEYGLSEPKTWDEMIKTAQDLQTNNRSGLIIETAPGYYQNFTWYPFLWQTGVDVFDPVRKISLINSEGGIKALALWEDLLNKYGVAPRSLTGTGGQIDILASGIAAMQQCGYWAVKTLERAFPDFEYGVCPLPIPDGGVQQSSYGGWTQMVNAYSPLRDEAARFSMWMWVEKIDLSVEWCTIVNTKFSPRKSVLEASRVFYSKWPNNIFRDKILPHARPEPRFPPEIVRIVEESLQEVMFSGVSANTVAVKAERKINSFLKKYKGKF